MSVWTAFECSRCGDRVQVMEVPAGHLDQRRFVCVGCLVARSDEKREAAEARAAVRPLAYNELPDGY